MARSSAAGSQYAEFNAPRSDATMDSPPIALGAIPMDPPRSKTSGSTQTLPGVAFSDPISIPHLIMPMYTDVNVTN
jgi:hypothetical protein